MTSIPLIFPTSYSFVNDRYGNAKEAIYFNSGFAKLIPEVYFSGDFTVTGWVFISSWGNYQRMLDCGSLNNQEQNVILGVGDLTFGPFMHIYKNGIWSEVFGSLVSLNTWYHLAGTLKGTNCLIYQNGLTKGSATCTIPNLVTRSNCFIGKSNWPSNTLANSRFDDIMFFNSALVQSQIALLMNFS